MLISGGTAEAPWVSGNDAESHHLMWILLETPVLLLQQLLYKFCSLIYKTVHLDGLLAGTGRRQSMARLHNRWQLLNKQINKNTMYFRVYIESNSWLRIQKKSHIKYNLIHTFTITSHWTKISH